VFIFKDTEPSPLHDSSGVRQKGDLLGVCVLSVCHGGCNKKNLSRIDKAQGQRTSNGPSLQKKKVSFIGTQFSNLYTAVDTPAGEAA
jgi:hypothetical protein